MRGLLVTDRAAKLERLLAGCWLVFKQSLSANTEPVTEVTDCQHRPNDRRVGRVNIIGQRKGEANKNQADKRFFQHGSDSFRQRTMIARLTARVYVPYFSPKLL